MDTSTLGKWAWLIALVVWVVVGALAGLGVDLGLPTIVTDLVMLLAFLGGIFFVAGMKDRTGFFIIALALFTFSAAVNTMFAEQVAQVGGLIGGILGGAAAAAGAAAAGALLVVVYNWIMDATK